MWSTNRSCTDLDLRYWANLVVMVAVSSYESYVLQIEAEPGAGRPDWLGQLDAGGVKVKVAVSITLIAAVHLLRDFMKGAEPTRLLVAAAVVLVFVLAAFVVARIDSHGTSFTPPTRVHPTRALRDRGLTD
jgi:uncharacterized protein (TIGR00645 family)